MESQQVLSIGWVVPIIIGLILGIFILHNAYVWPGLKNYHPKRYEQKVICYCKFAMFLYSRARFKGKIQGLFKDFQGQALQNSRTT